MMVLLDEGVVLCNCLFYTSRFYRTYSRW